MSKELQMQLDSTIIGVEMALEKEQELCKMLYEKLKACEAVLEGAIQSANDFGDSDDISYLLKLSQDVKAVVDSYESSRSAEPK